MDNPSFSSPERHRTHSSAKGSEAGLQTTQFHGVTNSPDNYGGKSSTTSADVSFKGNDVTEGGGDVKADQGEEGSGPDSVNLGFAEKQIRTFCLYLVFAAIGFSNGQRGPALLDLQSITDTDTEQGSYYVTSGFVGYLVGALLGGVTFDRLGHGSALLSVSLLGAGLTVASLPACNYFGLMVAIFFVNAFFLGAMDSCGNSELMRIWRAQARPYLQALHFSYAVGGVVSPLYTEPFLAPRQPANTSNHSETLEPGEATLTGETRVIYAFLVTGIYTATASLPFFIFALRDCLKQGQAKVRDSHEMTPVTPTTPRKDAPTVEVDSAPKKSRMSVPLRNFVVAMGLLWLFYFLYVPTEHIFRVYLLTFAVRQLDWSKGAASHLNSVYWGSWAASRFTGIFVTNCLSPARLLLCCCGSLILGFLAFLLSAMFDWTAGVWLFTATVGLSMSVVYPTGMLWVEENLFQVNGKLVASIGLISSAGNMANPPLYGFLMENYTFHWFSYLLLIESVVCTLVLLALFLYNRTVLSKVRNKS